MSSKTKIFVFKMRNLIYTAIFAALAILLIILMIIMFSKKNDNPSEGEHEVSYIPGVYTASIMLNNQALDVEVVVDANHINAVRFVNLDEAVTTMYPLMESVMLNLSTQVCEKQSTQSITYSTETQYTSMALLKVINTALNKAKNDSSVSANVSVTTPESSTSSPSVQ